MAAYCPKIEHRGDFMGRGPTYPLIGLIQSNGELRLRFQNEKVSL
jgi:hypothetical protein